MQHRVLLLSVKYHKYLSNTILSCFTIYTLIAYRRGGRERGDAKERNYDLQLLSIKADFHSVQNVPRSTFYDCLLSTNRQAELISLAVVDCKHFKRKQSQKIDRATFCTEWKSVFTRCSQPFSKSFPVNFISPGSLFIIFFASNPLVRKNGG